MLREYFSYPDGWTDFASESDSERPILQLVLGAFVLTIVLGYAGLRVLEGRFGGWADFLIIVFGGVLGTALLGEFVSSRCRSKWFKQLLVPVLVLPITYSLFGVSIAAGFRGIVDAGVVSVILVVCSFLALILEL